MLAINNVELISDRPLEVNLREIVEVKRAWPDRAVIVSAMVESKPEAWKEIVHRIEDTGADGIELNYGCPHGMSERGMGAAVGQVPEYTQRITEWVKEAARTPGKKQLAMEALCVISGALSRLEAGSLGVLSFGEQTKMVHRFDEPLSDQAGAAFRDIAEKSQGSASRMAASVPAWPDISGRVMTGCPPAAIGGRGCRRRRWSPPRTA